MLSLMVDEQANKAFLAMLSFVAGRGRASGQLHCSIVQNVAFLCLSQLPVPALASRLGSEAHSQQHGDFAFKVALCFAAQLSGGLRARGKKVLVCAIEPDLQMFPGDLQTGLLALHFTHLHLNMSCACGRIGAHFFLRVCTGATK